VLGGEHRCRAPWRSAVGGEGKVYVSNVNPGVSTTDQREEGFKEEMSENYPKIEVLETQFNKNDANKAPANCRPSLPAMPISKVFSGPICSPPLVLPMASSRPARAALSVWSRSMHPVSIVDSINSGLVDVAIAQHPAEIGYYGVISALRASDWPVDPDSDRHRFYHHGQIQYRPILKSPSSSTTSNASPRQLRAPPREPHICQR
jgi:ribose transport system substrate-binding protein